MRSESGVFTRPLAFWLSCAVGTIALDQLTKWLVLAKFREGERLNLLPFFDLILAYNPGAAFSFLAGAGGWQRWFFTGLAIVVSVFIIMWMRKEKRTLLLVALTLVLGGAIGNVIDRLIHGKVVDFILLYWKDWYYPAFNIADSAITIGAILLIWDSLFGPKESAKP
jgi:signal peptidase II